MGRKRGGRKRYVLLGLFFLAAFLPLSGWVPGLFPGTGSSPKDDTPSVGGGEEDGSFEVVVLRAEDQTPIEGARVLVRGVGLEAVEGVSDAQGRVHLPRQDGVYSIDVFAADRFEQQWVDPADRLELRLRRMATHRGTVRRQDGSPVTGTVRLVRKDNREVGQLRTDDRGRYEYPASPDLRYALLEPDEGPPAAAPVGEPLVVPPGEKFTGSFSEGGAAEMEVFIRFAPTGIDRAVVARAVWPVAPDGSYEGIVPEGAQVWGIRDGSTVKLGGRHTPVERVAVSGRVLDADGAAVARARVFFRPYAGGDFRAPVAPAETRTDAGGEFALNLAQGRYDIQVTHANFVSVSIHELEAGAEPLELQMERGRRLEGRVQRKDGTPVEGAQVSVPWNNHRMLVYRNGMRAAAATVSGTYTDRSGRFVLARFPGTATHLNVSLGDVYEKFDLAALPDPILLTLPESLPE